MDINSTPYWDSRFATDWEERNGPAQTAFFAFVAASMLPEWLKADINARALSVNDLGCAEGSALPYLARIFDRSRLTGSDVSAVAIEMARERHPEFDFSVIGVDPTLKTDVVFCSNTIEHFEDWQAKLNEFALTAGEHIIVIAPFREPEEGRFSEHFASFDFDVFPPEVGDGLTLSYFAALTTAYLPNSYWIGKQFMAVWSRQAATTGSAAAEAGSAIYSIDLRGLTPDQIRLAMKLSAESYSKLDAAWEAERSAKAELHAKVEEQKWKSTERENEFLTQRVALENELYTTRVMAQNQLHTMRVTFNNKLYAAGLTPDAEDLAPAAADLMPDTANLAPDTSRQTSDASSTPDTAGLVLDAADLVLDETGLAPAPADAPTAPGDAVAPSSEDDPETIQGLKQALADARNTGEKYRKTAADLVYAVEAYSSRLAVIERTLQARNEALNQNYRRILGMRSFRYLMKGLSAYGRLRGHTIALPSAPERSTITIERPDVRAWLKQSGDLAVAPPPVATARAGSTISTRDETPTRIVVIGSASARGSAHAAAIAQANAVLGQRTILAAPGDQVDGIAAAVGLDVHGLAEPAEAAVADVLNTANVVGLIAIGTDIGVAASENAGIPAFRVHGEGEPVSTTPLSPSARHFALSEAVASSLGDRMPQGASAVPVLKPALDVFRLIRPEEPLLRRLRRNRQARTTILLLGGADNKAASDTLAAAVAKLQDGFPHLIVAHQTSEGAGAAPPAPREVSRTLAEAHLAVALSDHVPEERLLEAGYFQLPIIAANTRFAQEACGDGRRGIVLPFAPLANDAVVDVEVVDRLVEALQTIISNYETWAQNAADSGAWALQYSGEHLIDLYGGESNKVL